MNLEQIGRAVRDRLKQSAGQPLQEQITGLFDLLHDEFGLEKTNLTQHEWQLIADALIDEQSGNLQNELEALLVEQERIARQIERKRESLQEAKHAIFNVLESMTAEESDAVQASVHQTRLHSIDLVDMLEELMESAIITTLEKNHDIEETVEEIAREITYETLGEGPLERERIRLVAGSVLGSALDVAEASPVQAPLILRGTLKGIRSGLIKAIRRLKKQLLFVPEELRLTEAMQNELLRTDTLFTQIVQERSVQCGPESRALLEKLSKEMRYDLEELVEVSKEAVEVMREQLSHVLSRSQVLNSKTAVEAKRMGISAWRSAKTTLQGALQNAKEKIDKRP